MVLVTGSVNLALNKPATQSSTWTTQDQSFTADKAVDGDQNSYSYTADDQHPIWWEVDLQDIYSIEKITIIAHAIANGK